MKSRQSIGVVRSGFMRSVSGLFWWAALVAAAPTAHAQGQPLRSAIPLVDQVGIHAPLGAKIPLKLDFVDADGRRVQLSDYFGHHPLILHLVYHQCPMLCKVSGRGLMTALDSLSLKPGNDFSILTVSFDPRDGPEQSAAARRMMRDHSGRDSLEHGWHFLTGDQPTITKLCEAVGFQYKYDESTGQFAHATGVFVLTADGTLSRFLSGVDLSPRDLRLAIVEASDGRVGTASDQVLLLCYCYDPSTGKYGLAIMGMLRGRDRHRGRDVGRHCRNVVSRATPSRKAVFRNG